MKFYGVRQASYADMDAILRIEDESFDPAVRESAGIFRERMEVFPEGFVILEAPRGVAGYLCSELWNLSAPPSPSDFAFGHSARERHIPRGRTLYISSFGIGKDFRGNGLGTALFHGFLDRARDTIPHNEIILLVSETWIGARAIYAAEGFSSVLTIPGFFRFSDGSRADGTVMRGPRAGRDAL